MKLAKKISKGIALCAALTIIGLGGVLTSCSNNSSDNSKLEEEREEDKKDEDEKTDDTTQPTETSLELTSIIGGIQDGEDVWGSGTKTVKESDGSYTVTAAGDGEGTWGGKLAAVPVLFKAGDLVGFSHIVAEVDLGGFTLSDDSAEYPAIELKIADDNDTAEKTKIINATKLYKDKKIEVSLAEVKDDILKSATRIMFTFRGTGTLKITDISKAKAKNSEETKEPETTPPDDDKKTEDDKKDEGSVGDGATDEISIFSGNQKITWADFLIIESSKFDGETPKAISIYLDCLETEQDNYVAMKIAANYSDAPLGDGTVEGGKLKEDDKGALEEFGNPGDLEKIVSYTPTADEWNDMITKTGLYINGNNVLIKKVTLK